MVAAWEDTPVHHLRLDVRSLLQDAVITEVCSSTLLVCCLPWFVLKQTLMLKKFNRNAIEINIAELGLEKKLVYDAHNVIRRCSFSSSSSSL